jgi:hypothetical protein
MQRTPETLVVEDTIPLEDADARRLPKEKRQLQESGRNLAEEPQDVHEKREVEGIEVASASCRTHACAVAD